MLRRVLYSPFLFVLVAEVLCRLYSQSIRYGVAEGLQIGKEGVKLSHLQFMDDTILFCPPRYNTIINYRWILDYFSVMSGFKINYDKSAFIPLHCDEIWVNGMKGILGCMVTKLPIRYLGIPLGANLNRVEMW